MTSKDILVAKDIKKTFDMEGNSIEVLHGLNLSLAQGESLAVVGGSGAGKSTFLHILGTLEPPSMGKVYFEGEDVFTWEDRRLANFRNKNLGFVFQFHYLLKEFNSLENVALPGQIGGLSKEDSFQRASELLFRLGMDERKDHYPGQLSGGEQQRVAVARALLMKPKLILADEPTGNLDKSNTERIRDLFLQIIEEYGVSLITVTHDQRFAEAFSRIKTMKDGSWS